MKRIRVLHVVPSLGLGGAERLIVDIVRNTSSERFEHALVQMQPPDNYTAALEPELTFLEQLRWTRPRGWLAPARQIARAARTFAPDIVQSVMFEANIAARLSRLFGARATFVTNVVSLDYDAEVARIAGWAPHKVAARRGLDATTAAMARTRFVACSRCVETATASALLAPPGRVRTIYNSVDPKTLEHDAAESVELRRANGIPDDAFVFLNVSRLIPTKAQDVILRAFRSVLEQLPETYLALVGGGPEELRLKALARELDIDARVRFVGQPKAIGASYGMGNAFVFPSLLEGLSLALVEAMLTGTPCIASAIPANVEVVDDGVTGLLFSPGDAQGLARAMVRLHDDPQLRATLGGAGRAFATDNFSSARVIPQWERLYEELAGSRPS